MKNILLLTSFLAITACSSVDSINKNTNCVVWRDQKVWGPFSLEVVEKKVEWKGSCKGYNNCEEILITLDENNNLLSKGEVLGKIENNEIHFAEKHALKDVVNYVGARAYPDQKIVKASFTENGVTTEESYKTNDKCTGETAIEGAVALGLVSKYHSKNKK